MFNKTFSVIFKPFGMALVLQKSYRIQGTTQQIFLRVPYRSTCNKSSPTLTDPISHEFKAHYEWPLTKIQHCG